MQPQHQQVHAISLTQSTINELLRLKFEYFQTLPLLMWKSKFYQTDSSSIVGSTIFFFRARAPESHFPGGYQRIVHYALSGKTSDYAPSMRLSTEAKPRCLRLNSSPVLVQIVKSRGALLSYAVLKKFHGST